MSRRRRSSTGSRRSLVRTLLRSERLATAVVVLGALLAVVVLALGEFVSHSRTLVALLRPTAAALPFLGAAIVAGACWAAWRADRDPRLPMLEGGDPPETAVTRTRQRVAHETERRLDAAADDWYRCRPTDATAETRGLLAEGAIRTLTAKHGLESEAARNAVRSGTWTDDPVAAAFLADGIRQPPIERLRGAVDPGAAYRRRLRRSLEAIDRLKDAARLERSEQSKQSERAVPAGVSNPGPDPDPDDAPRSEPTPDPEVNP